MATDFRSQRIRTNALIVSRSDASNASFVIYSGSDATNFTGGISDPTAMFSGVGSDVFLFVSGTRTDDKPGALPRGNRGTAVTLFGGDIVVSGTLYAERQVVEVDEVSTGSLLLSGALVVSQSATIVGYQAVGTYDYTALHFPNDSGKAQAIVWDGGDAAIFEANNELHLTAEKQVLILSGGAEISPNVDLYTDTNFAVSGAIGSSIGYSEGVLFGDGKRGTAVFGGDLVVSGNLRVIGEAWEGATGVEYFTSLSIDSDTGTDGNILAAGVLSVSGGMGTITVGEAVGSKSRRVTIDLDYFGTDNLIDVCPTDLEGTPINAGDSIIYHDADDNDVKKGFVSDLPFLGSTGTAFNVQGDTGTSDAIAVGETLDIAGAKGITTNRTTDNQLDVAIEYDGAQNAILEASDGTAITVDSANDRLLISDTDDSNKLKYIKPDQLGTSYNWIVAGDTGNTTVANTDTVTIAGTAPISTAESAGTVSVSLDTSGVTAGSYTSTDLTVDATGRITAASNGSSGMASWNIAGDSGSSTVTGGQSVDIEGGSGIKTTESSRTVTVDIETVGVGNAIMAQGNATPTGADTIWFNDSDGADTIKKSVISNLPFTNNAGTVTSVGTGDGLTGGAITGTGTLSVDYAGGGNFIMAATDGTGITVDGANDKLVIYDSDTTTVKYIKVDQLPTPAAGEWTLNSGDLYPNTPASTNVIVGNTATATADIVLGWTGEAIFNQNAASAGDFRMATSGKSGAILMDSGKNQGGLLTKGTTGADAYNDFTNRGGSGQGSIPEDVGIFISGSILGKDLTAGHGARGTTVIGGDAFVSGALWLDNLSNTTGTPSYSIPGGTIALYGKTVGSDTKVFYKYGTTERAIMGRFSITDGVNTETVNDTDTITFSGGAGAVAAVAATDSVLFSVDYTGADNVVLSGQNGTGITVDPANDKILVNDADDSNTAKYINISQLPGGGGGSMSQFFLEDDEKTEVQIDNDKELKLSGTMGTGTIFTDTSPGSDVDPFVLGLITTGSAAASTYGADGPHRLWRQTIGNMFTGNPELEPAIASADGAYGFANEMRHDQQYVEAIGWRSKVPHGAVKVKFIVLFRQMQPTTGKIEFRLAGRLLTTGGTEQKFAQYSDSIQSTNTSANKGHWLYNDGTSGTSHGFKFFQNTSPAMSSNINLCYFESDAFMIKELINSADEAGFHRASGQVIDYILARNRVGTGNESNLIGGSTTDNASTYIRVHSVTVNYYFG